MKIKQKQMIFKMDGKFEWCGGPVIFFVNLPPPRSIRYIVTRNFGKWDLDLERLSNNGHNLHIGKFASDEEAKARAELREARYEVKKETMERKHENISQV